MATVSIQKKAFSSAVEMEALRNDTRDTENNTGAIVIFTGLMREFSDSQKLDGLFLEHYPGMAEKQILQIVEIAKGRWPILNARVVHRYGEIYPNDEIVFVGVSSEHRRAAFQACEFIMDFLKTEAPFWKKEIVSGKSTWVDAKESDCQEKEKWDK